MGLFFPSHEEETKEIRHHLRRSCQRNEAAINSLDGVFPSKARADMSAVEKTTYREWCHSFIILWEEK